MPGRIRKTTTEPAPKAHSRTHSRIQRNSASVTVIALHDFPSTPSTALSIDIDDEDGYTLSAFGDVSLSDAYLIPTSESTGSQRIRRPPMPRRSSGSASPERILAGLGRVSPTHSGYRFPDLPSPSSPATEKANFQALVDALKLRDARATAPSSAPSTPHSMRHPSGLAPPARKPTLRLDTLGSAVRNTGIPPAAAPRREGDARGRSEVRAAGSVSMRARKRTPMPVWPSTPEVSCV